MSTRALDKAVIFLYVIRAESDCMGMNVGRKTLSRLTVEALRKPGVSYLSVGELYHCTFFKLSYSAFQFDCRSIVINSNDTQRKQIQNCRTLRICEPDKCLFTCQYCHHPLPRVKGKFLQFNRL